MAIALMTYFSSTPMSRKIFLNTELLFGKTTLFDSILTEGISDNQFLIDDVETLLSVCWKIFDFFLDGEVSKKVSKKSCNRSWNVSRSSITFSGRLGHKMESEEFLELNKPRLLLHTDMGNGFVHRE
ncbi:Uncharacterized protein Fot_32356 [Forsythia ovata]|uniref:Uncharacterized protein n=1 Tax=Forsythia ovata TaxID=205694 RepID=A0ABD1T7K0_9LAMI